MITFLRSRLRSFLLLLTVAAPTFLSAATISIGDGFSLSDLSRTTFLNVHPGQSNAGYTNSTPTVFQLFDIYGNSGSGTITYGTKVTAQSTVNNLWLTLDSDTNFTSGYIRNNATQPSWWEQLYFIPINASIGNTITDGDQVYLTHTPDGGHTFFYVSFNSGSATTTSNISDATPLIIHAASFSPYIPGENYNTAITYDNNITLSSGTGWTLNMTYGSNNAGTIAGDTPTQYLLLRGGGDHGSAPATYGNVASLKVDLYFVTMKPAPGVLRNDTESAGEWENLYFISVSGRNGDQIYDQDRVYLARNSYTSGNYVTEYVAVSGDGTVSTTANAADATSFIIESV